MKLLVDDKEVSTFDPSKVAVPVSYSVKESQEPWNIKGSRSTTLKLPKDKRNFVELGNPLAVNDDTGIKKAHITDGGTVFQGRADIISRSDEYELRLFGDNAEWFQYFKDTDLNELDLGITTLTVDNVVDSWASGVVYYGIVDYGEFQDRDNTYDVQIEQLRPAIRVKELLDKAFNEVDHSIEWKGALGEKKWTLPFTQGEINTTPGFVKDYRAAADGGGFINNLSFSNGSQPLPTGNETHDPSNSLSGTEYTAPFTGTMDFNIVSELVIEPFAGLNGPLFINIVKDDGLAGEAIVYTRLIGIAFNYGNTLNVDFAAEDVDVVAGSTYTVHLHTTVTTAFNVVASSVSINYLLRDIIWQVDFEYEPGKTLPKMSLMSIIKAINTCYDVVWETSNGKITATPFTEWRGIETDDWTDKTDLSEPHKWSKYQHKRKLKYEWKEDKDLLARRFRGRNGRGFGDAEVLLQDENLEGERKITLDLSATLMGVELGYDVPKLLKDDDRNVGEDNYREAHYDWNPRLLLEKQYTGDWTFEGVSRDTFPTMVFVERGSDSFTDNLCFGEEENYGNQVGLLDKHWKEHIAIWNDKKQFEGIFRLNSTDIRNLDFSRPKLIQVDNGTRVVFMDEIKQYKHGINEPTKVKGYG